MGSIRSTSKPIIKHDRFIIRKVLSEEEVASNVRVNTLVHSNTILELTAHDVFVELGLRGSVERAAGGHIICHELTVDPALEGDVCWVGVCCCGHGTDDRNPLILLG